MSERGIRMNKRKAFEIMTVIYCCSLIISNVLTNKQFLFAGMTLTCGILVFPIVYIINDVLTEVYGFHQARKTILMGFAMNLMAVIFYIIAIVIPGAGFCKSINNAMATLLGSSFRILVASFAAYIVGSLINSLIMKKMKCNFGKYLMLRCVLSTLAGEGIDSLIFFSVAFVGTLPKANLIMLMISQTALKTLYEIIVYPVTRKVIFKVKALKD